MKYIIIFNRHCYHHYHYCCYQYYYYYYSIENSKKLEFYKTFEDEYSTSDYLYQLRHYDERQNIVKFKISNHKLLIEQGRYQVDHLLRQHRLCRLCNSIQVEDDIHFFFQCNKYSVQRQAFINQINRIIPDFNKNHLQKA